MNTTLITPDFTKIVPYSPSDNNQGRETTVRRYQGNGLELLYINAGHVNDTDNPTCNKIRETIELLHPQRVVVEAQSSGTHGEVAFAESLCLQHGIPVVYGEPNDKDIFNGMKDTEYSQKDIMALYLLRTIPQDRRMEMKMDETSFAERAIWYLNQHPAFTSIEPKDRLTYDEFKTKYASKLGGKDFLNADANDFAPYLTEDATYFQKLHGTIAQIREKMVNSTVANVLNEPDVSRVLVIYGGAHRIMSEPMWEAALGKGVDIDPRLEAATQAISHFKQPVQDARHELGNTTPRNAGNTDIAGVEPPQP